MSKASKSESVEEKTRRYILDPNLWLCWPLFPVKKAGRGSELGDLGFVFATKELVGRTEFVVYLGNMYEAIAGRAIRDFPQQKYDTIDALLADGWMGD